MKLFIELCVMLSIVLGAIGTPLSLNEEEEWENFKIKYGKSYNAKEEDQFRMKIFLENKERIERHNDLHANGLKTYRLGINMFADLTLTELRKMMNCYNGQMKSTSEKYNPPPHEELPSTVDWTKKGAVTPVKNQKACGSCWAFSATGSLEGQHFLKTGKLVSLSEQNLIDCSWPEGNYGCNGGLMNQSFEYVKKNNGIDTEASYKYTAMDETNCKYNKKEVGATCAGYKDISSGDESALQSAVANIGPISVGIDAGLDSFFSYESGVYYAESCSSKYLNHAVLAVGYGSENGIDYWLVKNSWGADWGMKGYIKMSRNRNNNCGIASDAIYPMV